MNWVQVVAGCLAMVCGAGLLFTAVIAPPPAPTPFANAKVEEPEEYQPPPEGPVLAASVGEKWKMRDGRTVTIDERFEDGRWFGYEAQQPIEIPGYVGSTMREMFAWRGDGVSMNNAGYDLIERVPQ